VSGVLVLAGKRAYKGRGKRMTSGTATKVVWYLLVIHRLKNLFANKKEAELMRWHATRMKVSDDVMRHHADGFQWKSIDAEYTNFGKDPRHI
jgi:hypothetical protein